MAFPIPSHLPRKKNQDVSTKLLSKMSETTFKSLTHEIASSWVAELDVSIRQTKEQINERIQTDQVAFDRQFASSKSVQERLQTLSENVDRLSSTLSNSETGLVPNLIMSLTKHAALAQDATDAHVKRTTLSYLAECRSGLQNLARLVQEGRLPDAMEACNTLEELLARAPPPLQQAGLLGDIKRTFRASKDRTDEQLNDAYSRSVTVNTSEIIVRLSVQVRDSTTILSLASVVSSLAPTSLNTLMGTLRRDITSQWISRILQHSALVEVSSLTALTGDAEHKLSIVLYPPSLDGLTTRISNLSTVLTFLNQYLFPHLPSSASFPSCLSKPVTSAILNELLIPSLPSSASGLPAFLELMTCSVKFEEEYIGGMLGDSNRNTDIKRWADAVAAHYEKKRRADILEDVRRLITQPEDDSTGLRVALSPTTSPEPVKVDTPPPPERVSSPEDVAWGLDEEHEGTTVDEEGWGLEDAEEPQSESISQTETAVEADQKMEEDDPWALNDGEEQPVNTDVSAGSEGGSSDSFAWDDPWEDETTSISSPSKPKTATRLAKLSRKGKSLKDAPPVQSPIPIAPPPPTPAMTSSVQPKPVTTQPRAEQELYMVSGRAKELVALVEHVLREAADLAGSPVLAPYAAVGSSAVGSILYQVSTQTLDLYRALYPVAASAVLLGSAKRSACFSNDCLWISEQTLCMASHTSTPANTSGRLRECSDTFKLLSDSWFDDTLRMQEQKVLDTLDQAKGFVGTTDQDRFDECEDAVNLVLQDIRRVAQQCKSILPKSKYYRAIGIFVNAALGRILNDILALSDITAQESHRLSELCRILNALEGLFVQDPDQPSFVVAYVPLWLKFSYLSELLEASIADISYLFEEGALVDFEIDELVNLVRALFSDTPLRTNTINKLMRGHPPIVS